MAHKKAAWSAKNLRDSNAKYRWVKLFGGQVTKAGNIIIRQKGSKYETGANTYLGRDFSIHASIDWVVKFSKKNKSRFDGRTYLKTYVSVEGVDAVVTTTKVKAPAKKAEPKKVAIAKKPAADKKTAKTTSAKKAPAKKTTTTKAKAEK